MKRAQRIVCNSGGFTLVELILVMGIMVMVLVISAGAFNTILTNSGRIFKSEESNIEGVAGLEMLRHDLQQAGYGLYSENGGFNYLEAVDTLPAVNNDAPNNAPRPLVFNSGMDGTQSVNSYVPLAGTCYLSIKGTTVSRSLTAQRWTFMNMTSTHSSPPVVNSWRSGADNLLSTDNVVVVQKQFGVSPKATLVTNQSGGFYSTFSNTAFKNLSTASNGMYLIYGVDNVPLRFPFNRSDYFVATPAVATDLPASCAPGAGILYKTMVNHADGKLSYIPVLDCVLDLQVVLGWDTDGDGTIDTWSSADGSRVMGTASVATVQSALATANNNSITNLPNIRTNLKIVKVYVIAQDGKKDPAFVNNSPLALYDEQSLTRPGGLTLTAAQRNYRWKLYRIVVRPKNLMANQ